ncbi:MAG: hypothetical protein ACP5OG_02160 [Candidatus Nanoarchaeia archaeon]
MFKLVLITLVFFVGSGGQADIFDDIENFPLIAKEDLDLLKENLVFYIDSGFENKPTLEQWADYLSIILDCPIPVYIMDRHRFHQFLIESNSYNVGNSEDFQSLHITRKIKGWPEEFMILVYEDKPSYSLDALIISYFHELKHHICKKEDCICKCDRVLCEIHAYEYEVQMCFEHGFDKALELSVKSIAGEILVGDHQIYISTLYLLTKQDTWINAVNYLRQKEMLD